MGYKNNKEYRKAHKEGKIQTNIPSTADKVYTRQKTWTGWKDFLGRTTKK